MGWKSPVGEPASTLVCIPMLMILTTSRRQGQFREGLSEGSLSAKQRADGQKSHTRPSSRGELAQGNETHGFAGQGKCGSCAVTVHVLIRGDLSGVRWFRHSAEISNGFGDWTEVSRGHSSGLGQGGRESEGPNISQGGVILILSRRAVCAKRKVTVWR